MTWDIHLNLDHAGIHFRLVELYFEKEAEEET
jgi:hypothetical protein